MMPKDPSTKGHLDQFVAAVPSSNPTMDPSAGSELNSRPIAKSPDQTAIAPAVQTISACDRSEVGVPSLTPGDHKIGRDDFGRVLFPMPGYETC
jgi:hypothetical protein